MVVGRHGLKVEMFVVLGNGASWRVAGGGVRYHGTGYRDGCVV